MDFTELYADSVSSVAVAARSGCRRRLRRLMKRGFSVDRRDNRGWNALHQAAAAGSAECVQEILSAAAGGKKGPNESPRGFITLGLERTDGFKTQRCLQY